MSVESEAAIPSMMEQANKHLIDKEYKMAEGVYQRVILASPERINPEAHRALGDSLLMQNRIIDAIKSYNTAIEQRKGEYPEAHNHLGHALFKDGKFEDSIKSFQTAIEQRGGSYPCLLYTSPSPRD